jgi:Fic-DOC domain mobile mystery protein B
MILNNNSFGSTPIDPDEVEGLKPSHITTMQELNRWEYDNILQAEKSVFSRKQSNVLTEDYARKLHKKMFGNVWKWAGSYRFTNKNIGIEAYQIASAVRNLVLDTATWVEHSVYEPLELAVRFHHKLVYIHPFPNGNGRHARLMTDILLVHVLKSDRFTWGHCSLDENSDTRVRYIQALRDADNGDYAALMEFVVS